MARPDDAAGQFPAPADLDVRRFDAGDGARLSRGVDGQLPPQPGAVQVGGRRRLRQLALRRTGQAQHGDVRGGDPGVQAGRQAGGRRPRGALGCRSGNLRAEGGTGPTQREDRETGQVSAGPVARQ
ncbi:MAG: hypothetical protein V4475_01380 [Pseudomonadota bacterium]